MPKISIIVPVYKVEQFLPKCIDSILSQTYQNWELLLIDDGSPDNSGIICDEYAQKDKRIRVFHKENGGVSSARNIGIDNAIGEWITFIDSDDYIQPGFLEGLYAPIAQGEEVDFVHGGCVNVKNEEIVSVNQSYELYVGEDKNILFQKLRGLTFSKLFRLENVKYWSDGQPLRFDEKMKIAEDMVFTLDYALHVSRFALVPEKGYCYRIDNMQSATRSRKLISYDIKLNSFLHYYKSVMSLIEAHNINPSIAQIRLKHLCSSLRGACLSLYKNNFSRKERIEHLKRDFNGSHLSVLRYNEGMSLWVCLFSLLQLRCYLFFDLVTSLLYSLKR